MRISVIFLFRNIGTRVSGFYFMLAVAVMFQPILGCGAADEKSNADSGTPLEDDLDVDEDDEADERYTTILEDGRQIQKDSPQCPIQGISLRRLEDSRPEEKSGC